MGGRCSVLYEVSLLNPRYSFKLRFFFYRENKHLKYYFAGVVFLSSLQYTYHKTEVPRGIRLIFFLFSGEMKRRVVTCGIFLFMFIFLCRFYMYSSTL